MKRAYGCFVSRQYLGRRADADGINLVDDFVAYLSTTLSICANKQHKLLTFRLSNSTR
jgi:hypothetical protein